MLLCCLKCTKSAESKNPKVGRTKNRRIKCTVYNVHCTKCTVCNSKNRFIKEQEASGLLSSLGIKASLRKKLL